MTPARSRHAPPADTVRVRVQGVIPPDLLPEVPRKWEKLGDVLVVKLPPSLDAYRGEVARAFADVLGARCVVRDAAGVGGEFREFKTEVLHGEDPVTTHVENGIRYRFDASRIMFSSGNVDERVRVAHLDCRGETVVDMFTGIGYFALPLAVHAGADRVYALEKNPRAHGHLVENLQLNGVADRVEAWLGDNRDFPREGEAHRVHMGYFPGTEQFLPKALRLLRPEGGWIHYHNTSPHDGFREALLHQVQAAATDAGRQVVEAEARRAKNYAPGIVHGVVAARVE